MRQGKTHYANYRELIGLSDLHLAGGKVTRETIYPDRFTIHICRRIKEGQRQKQADKWIKRDRKKAIEK